MLLLPQIVLNSACGKQQKMGAKFIHALGSQYRFHHWPLSHLKMIGNNIFQGEIAR